MFKKVEERDFSKKKRGKKAMCTPTNSLAIDCTPLLCAEGSWDLLCFPHDVTMFPPSPGQIFPVKQEERESNYSRAIWYPESQKWVFFESNRDWQLSSLRRYYRAKEAHVHVPAEQSQMDGELHILFETKGCSLTLSIPLVASCCSRTSYESWLLTEDGKQKTPKYWCWNRIGSMFAKGFTMWTLENHHHIQSRLSFFLSPDDINLLKRNHCIIPPRTIDKEKGYGLPLVIAIERSTHQPETVKSC